MRTHKIEFRHADSPVIHAGGKREFEVTLANGKTVDVEAVNKDKAIRVARTFGFRVVACRMVV